MPFECQFCTRTFSTRSSYSQHVSRCIPPDQSSSEESSLITNINDMSLESKRFSNDEEVNKLIK